MTAEVRVRQTEIAPRAHVFDALNFVALVNKNLEPSFPVMAVTAYRIFLVTGVTTVPPCFMTVWTWPQFTSDIYRLRNPQSTLHLAALFHGSVSPRGLTLGMAQPAGKSPAVWPYGVG